MKNLCKISVTCAPVQALNKLSRANIPVFNCNKQGARFTFSISDNNIKKVFAIFEHPCYNVIIKQYSLKRRLIKSALSRPVLILGTLAFIAAAVLSNCFICKITVTGSGSYLKTEVAAIARSLGVNTYTFYKGIDEQLFCARVMALPQVTFCSVHKSGSVLYINVQTASESAQSATYTPLYADKSGVVNSVTAICGTPLVSAGDSVTKGDMLIGAYYLTGEARTQCLAVGFASLMCSGTVSVFASEDNEQNQADALSAALLYAGDEQIISRNLTAQTVADGVIYKVDFTYIHILSINID